MTLNTMKTMLACRSNLVGFLNIVDIIKLNDIFIHFDVDHKSFREIEAALFNEYDLKLISNKQASFIVDILVENNSIFRRESHSYDSAYHNLYEWDSDNQAYVFLKKSNNREFLKLNMFLED